MIKHGTQKNVAKEFIRTKLTSTPVSARSLSHATGLSSKHDTSPELRDLIRELINEGVPIGANSRGYFKLTTGKEVQVYLNSLLERQLGITHRIQAVYNAAKTHGLI